MTAFGMHCMKNQDVHAAATRVLETEEGKVSKSDTAPAPFPRRRYPLRRHLRRRRTGKPYTCACTPGKPCTGPRGCCSGSWPQVTPPGNAPAVAPVAAAPAYTVEQIGQGGADLVSQDDGKMPELLALLQKYGAQAITQLKPEQLGAFATELRGLGAKL